MPRVLNRPHSQEVIPWEAPPLAAGTPAEGEEAEPEVGEDPLAQARHLAQQELAEARQQAQEELEAARARGYAEGSARAEAELRDKRQEVEALVAELNAQQDTFFARLEQEAIELALAVAAKVLDYEVEAHPEIVVAQVRRCLRRVKERERIRLRVHPDDVALVRAQKEDLVRTYDGIERLDILDDQRVGRGGCEVESVNGILDARLDRQLKEVARALQEATGGGGES